MGVFNKDILDKCENFLNSRIDFWIKGSFRQLQQIIDSAKDSFIKILVNDIDINDKYIWKTDCDNHITVYISKDITKFGNIFANSYITKIDFSNFYGDNIRELNYLLCECPYLCDVNFGNAFKNSHINNVWKMFFDCSRLKYVDLSNINLNYCDNLNEMFEDCLTIEKIIFPEVLNPSIKYTRDTFRNCKSLKIIENFDKINFSNLHIADKMFNGCGDLEEIKFSNDITSFDNFLSGISMFENCSSLKTVEGFTNKELPILEFFNRAFAGCLSLQKIDMSKCKFFGNFKSCFEGCHSLKKLDISSFSLQFDNKRTMDFFKDFILWTNENLKTIPECLKEMFTHNQNLK